MSSNTPSSENTYVIDHENGAEMARLLDQDRTVTRHMGGLFPDAIDPAGLHDVLDIACGPGGWVQEVAFHYPEIKVTGTDLSRTMIEYARAMARVQSLDNAHFLVMDATKPLDFPDHSFDFVNVRFIIGFMPAAEWPAFVHECMRVLRPGGVLRLTEGEYSFTNAPACERLNGLIIRALQHAQQTFAPGGRNIGITTMLSSFLRRAGCQKVQHQAYAIEFSTGTEGHYGSYENLKKGFKLIQPFLIKHGVTTQEEVDQLYEQALLEMLMEDFCSLGFYLSAWGERPAL